MSSERALPRTQRRIEFQAYEAMRRSPVYASVGHAVLVEFIKIGNDYHGKPVETRNVRSKAVCGVQVGKGSGRPYEAPVNCRRCLAILKRMEASGVGEEALAASVLRAALAA